MTRNGHDLRKKYPERIPVEVISKSSMHVKKYLVPEMYSIGQFMSIVRAKNKITAEQSLFCFIKDTIPSSSETMINVYEQFKNDEGVLEIVVSKESTFG